MLQRRTHRDLVWIDVESPTTHDIRPLAEEYGIHPLVADELLGPSLKPKVDYHGTLIYCVLHFPALKHSHRESTDQEIDFVIGKNFLITAHYDTIDPLLKFSKVFEVNSTLNHDTLGEHAGYIFYYLVKKLYRSLHNELAIISGSLSKIEKETFRGRERDMVIELSKTARDILTMKRALSLHGDVLSSLRHAAKRMFGEEFDFYLRDIEDEYTKVIHSLRDLSESLHELRSTNDSLLTTKQNQIAQTLTVMAFMVLPTSLIATLFSMQVESIPFTGQPNGFWLVFGIIVTVILFIYLFFKRKEWI